MPQFRIRDNGFAEIKKKLMLRTFIVMAAALTTGIVISILNDGHRNVLPVVIPLMAAFMGYRMYKAMKRTQGIFASYRLTVESDVVSREQSNLKPLTISRIEIKEIAKNKDGCIVIKGLTATDIIYVPAQIDNGLQLESLLHTMHPLTVKTQPSFAQRYFSLLLLAMLASMLGVFISMNKIIVSLCGSLLVAALAWAMYEIQRGKNYDQRIKRSSWWMLVMLLAVIYVMVVKLTGTGSE